MTVQVIRSLARFGPRLFYVLNTGLSTIRPFKRPQRRCCGGILLRYTEFGTFVEQAASRIRQQEAGSHADELETSMMLHIAPSSVDMKSAVKDLGPPSTPLRLTRTQGAAGTYSPTGTWETRRWPLRPKGRSSSTALFSEFWRTSRRCVRQRRQSQHPRRAGSPTCSVDGSGPAAAGGFGCRGVHPRRRAHDQETG